MKSYDIKHPNGHTYRVTAEKHGYRIRFWEKDAGYIGCYYPANKRFGFTNSQGERIVSGEAPRGPKAAATQLCYSLFY